MSQRSIASDESAAETISGINVTPLVDITLVLLIVFMVSARFIVSQALPMDSPKASPGREVQLALRVEIRASGDILVDGERVPNDQAVYPIARERYAQHPHVCAVIRVDPVVEHGRVIRVLDLMKQAGVEQVAFAGDANAAATGGRVQPAPTDAKP